MGTKSRLPVFDGDRCLNRFIAKVGHLCSALIAVGTAMLTLVLLCGWTQSDIENEGVEDEAVEEIHALVEDLYNDLIRNVTTTMANIRAIGSRVDQFIENRGYAPHVQDINDLPHILAALRIDTQGLDLYDGWGNPLRYECDPSPGSGSYNIISYGSDGSLDTESAPIMVNPARDIIWANGSFRQEPYIDWEANRYAAFRVLSIDVSGAEAIATLLLLHGDQSYEQDVMLRLEDGVWGVGRLSAIRSRGSISQINNQARHNVEEFLEAYRAVDLDLLSQLVTDERVLQAMWQASSLSFLSSPEEIERQREMLGTLEWEIEEITQNEDWRDIAIARVEVQYRDRSSIIELALRLEESWKVAGFSLISETERPIDVVGRVGNIIPPQYSCYSPLPYPRRARLERRGGRVRIRVFITREGVLENIEVLSEDPPGYGFGEAAIQHMRQCQWTPAIKDGRPIYARYTFIFLFQLQR